MENSLLMTLNEPTDKQLIGLMKEVVEDAKNKALSAKKILAEQILLEISNAQAKFRAKK